MNIAQLASLKKPEDVNLGRIDSKYEKNYVDERSMQNMAKESALNTRDALMSASGGSGGRASANLLASQTLANKGMSDAYFKSKEINAAEDKYAQEFDMKSNVRNLMQGNQETAYNLQRDAAYKENKSALMAAIGNDLGGIGQEELFKKYPEMMGLGYDSRGNAVGREESDYDESFATNKTSGEEKKKAEASLGEDSKANNFRTKPSERQGVSFEDVDVDEVNPSATSAATSAEGANNTPSAGTKGTISEQQVKKAEEIKRVAPQIYAPGIMELPIAGSYPEQGVSSRQRRDNAIRNLSKENEMKLNNDWENIITKITPESELDTPEKRLKSQAEYLEAVNNGKEKEYIDSLKKKQKTKQGPKPYLPPESNITSDNMPIIDTNENKAKSSSPSLGIDNALKFPWERDGSVLPVDDKKEVAEAKAKSNEIIETDVKDFYGRNVKISSDIKPQFDTARRLMKERGLGDLKITDSHVRSDVKEAAKKRYDKNVAKFKKDGFYLNHEGKNTYKMPPRQAGKKSFHTTGKAFDLNQKEYNPKSTEFKLIKHLLISAGFKQHPGEWWHFSVGEFDD